VPVLAFSPGADRHFLKTNELIDERIFRDEWCDKGLELRKAAAEWMEAGLEWKRTTENYIANLEVDLKKVDAELARLQAADRERLDQRENLDKNGIL
jgi:hypothetical protein